MLALDGGGELAPEGICASQKPRIYEVHDGPVFQEAVPDRGTGEGDEGVGFNLADGLEDL